jgi:hypothetical protein
MSEAQDPYTHVGYLRQCLSSDKKPLGLLLGAGCPMAIRSEGKSLPLIPDIAGITKVVCSDLSKCDKCGPLFKTLESSLKKDGQDKANIEYILGQIRALRAIAGNDKVRGLSAQDLDALEHKVCDSIYELADKMLPNSETPYHRLASWVDATKRDQPVEVFTTNYDLLMEQAFESCYVPYFDGFAGGHKPLFNPGIVDEGVLPARWARLWKLHGSINWWEERGSGVYRSIAKKENGARRAILPSHLKYEESRQMPYLAMFDRLLAFLRRPYAALVICGYSFRDQHINHIIAQGLRSNLTSIAFALLYGDISDYEQATGLAKERFNLILLARDGGIRGGQSFRWIQRDAEAVPSGNGAWVKWSPSDASKKDSSVRAEFALGDFLLFGQFLREIAGNGSKSEEAAGAN